MKEDYQEFINNFDDDYDEEYEIEEKIDEIRGTVYRGDCIYCGAKMAMTYEGEICFICDKCERSIHEDLYYRWILGYDVEMDDE